MTPPHVIHVKTVEGLNSDKPGRVSLMVDEDIYDSLRGDCLMIPKGAFINGMYSADVKVGQERLLVASTSLRLPNGKSVPTNPFYMSKRIGRVDQGLNDVYAYGIRNTEHARILARMAELDERMGREVDRSAMVVRDGRVDVHPAEDAAQRAVRRRLVEAAAGPPLGEGVGGLGGHPERARTDLHPARLVVATAGDQKAPSACG